jgi:hypothetical protein
MMLADIMSLKPQVQQQQAGNQPLHTCMEEGGCQKKTELQGPEQQVTEQQVTELKAEPQSHKAQHMTPFQ